MPSRPKRFFHYILSLIGLERFTSDDSPFHASQSPCSFMSSSTLFVKPLADPWMLETWMNSLSKSALCDILLTAMTQCRDVPWPALDPPVSDTWRLQEQARMLVHRLDHLRPSDQFGRAHEIAQGLERLVRACHGLDNPTDIITALTLVVQQTLEAPPEVRQHLYSQAKLGRLVILEMANVFKYHDLAPSPPQSGWLDQVEQVCGRLARYDPTWEFRQEYDNVPIMAGRYAS